MQICQTVAHSVHNATCIEQPLNCFSTHGRRSLQGFLPQLDEFYFTTTEKKLFENYKYIVPNFNND